MLGGADEGFSLGMFPHPLFLAPLHFAGAFLSGEKVRALLPDIVDVLMHGAAGFGWGAGFDGFKDFPVLKGDPLVGEE